MPSRWPSTPQANDPRVRSMVEGQYRVNADDLYLVTAWGEGREERWNVTPSADAAAFADAFDAELSQPLPDLYDTADARPTHMHPMP